MSKSLHDDLLRLCAQYPHLQFVFRHSCWETDFLRFFRSQVNYNIRREAEDLYVRVYKGQRSCSFVIDDPDMHKLQDKLDEALGIIDSLPPDPDFVDLETDRTVEPAAVTPDNITQVPLDRKIEILQHLSDAVEPLGFRIYGTFICNRTQMDIINSNGVDKHLAHSPVMLEVKAVSDRNEVTVLQSFGGEDFSRFNLETFTTSLKRKAELACNEVTDVEPGEWTVILAPRCVTEFLEYLSFGMMAEVLDRKVSWFEGKVGQKVFPEIVSITDDPRHPELINYQYNGDGHVCRPLPLVERGVFRNFLVDNYYAHKTGLAKNGADGICLVMDTGDVSLEQMFAGIERGLYISSLHYMNFINPRETSVTGLTRDGTFLIEHGKPTRVVNNLRFTQRISAMFERITQVENAAAVVPFSGNYENFDIITSRVPHVRVDGFKISSSTKTV